MKNQRTQTSFAFNSSWRAEKFKSWLIANEGDRDFGYPKFIDLKNTTVQCSFDLNHPAVRKEVESLSSVVRQLDWYGYRIIGNEYLAIAVNLKDPKDAHYFTIDPEVNNDAFVRAQGWAYPGDE